MAGEYRRSRGNLGISVPSSGRKAGFVGMAPKCGIHTSESVRPIATEKETRTARRFIAVLN